MEIELIDPAGNVISANLGYSGEHAIIPVEGEDQDVPISALLVLGYTVRKASN